MAHEHDSGYKFLFSTPELVRDLIIGFVPDEWLHGLDYTTLELVPGHYITEDFRSRADDIVWRVKVGEDWVYLYLLIEFQSSVDKHMALRMMVYLGLLYQALIKRGEIFACGTPALTSNVTSMPEVAGDAALLVNPESVDEIVNAMGRLMSDEVLRTVLIARGLERAKMFTWERVVQRVRTVLDHVAATQENPQ